ncbi:ankyrin repeat-containing domain protein [Trichoderma ceciliae]
MSMPDDPVERRRIQNRMAQRRFRLRQRNQDSWNAIELIGQKQNAPAELQLEAIHLGGRLEDFGLTTNDGSSLPINFSNSLSSAESLNESFSLLDGNSRLDHFTGLDANGNCISYAISEPLPSTISTSPANSTTVENLGCGRMQSRNPSPAQSEGIRYASKKQSLEAAVTTTANLIRSSNFSSPDSSSTGVPIDHPSAGTSPGTSNECCIQNPGWLGALHMAARRGHGGIVRLLLHNHMDINERDSDGLTPLMHAVAGGHEEVVNLLLAHGACLGDVDNHRRSVLHWAVLTYREPLLRLLLEHAVTDDPLLMDGYDDTGCTPLHVAIDSSFELGVSILVEFGVNLHSRARKP